MGWFSPSSTVTIRTDALCSRFSEERSSCWEAADASGVQANLILMWRGTIKLATWDPCRTCSQPGLSTLVDFSLTPLASLSSWWPGEAQTTLSRAATDLQKQKFCCQARALGLR